jgi:hypothetical protein
MATTGLFGGRWARHDPAMESRGTDTGGTGADDVPLRLYWQGSYHPVAHVANRWRTLQTWWTVQAHRDYFKLATPHRATTDHLPRSRFG